MDDSLIRQVKEEEVNELNETIFENLSIYLKFEERSDRINAASFALKDSSGLESYIINVNDDIIDQIEDYYKRKNCKVMWNNTHAIFWLI